MTRRIRLAFRLFAALTLCISVALNVVVFSVWGAFAMVSGALNSVGITTAATQEVSERVGKRKAQKKIAKDTRKSVSERLGKAAARNIGTSFGEAVPFLGTAVIVGGLYLEIEDACQNAKEMAGLEAAINAEKDPTAAQIEAMESFDCSETLIPDREDLPSASELWRAAYTAPGEALATVKENFPELLESEVFAQSWEWVTASTQSVVGSATSFFNESVERLKGHYNDRYQ
uniref:hypothetical protein n=1 Tax=Ruegeria arenilitoris TaxID=1173585 RepID=UPI00147E5F35|nr:hypothetical protein [Ruegeria arenilitoris]